MIRAFMQARLRRVAPAVCAGITLAATAVSAAGAESVSVTDPRRQPQPLTVAIGDVTVREPLSNPEAVVGAPAAVPARFVVKLSRPHSGPVTVAFRTSDGTAKAGADYLARAGTVTIPAGATSAPVDVMVRQDRAVEGDETFFVTLTGVTNVIGIGIRDGRAIGTILDYTF